MNHQLTMGHGLQYLLTSVGQTGWLCGSAGNDVDLKGGYA